MPPTEYRVDELADAAGISVELLRSYQSKGLLPQPRHRGRLAMYDDGHLERLRAIRDLKSRGYSLKMIATALERGTVAPPPSVLTDSVVATEPLEEESLTLKQVAERSGMPPAMLRSLESSGVLRPRHVGDERRYTNADARAMRMLLTLIGTGLPLEEFLRVARVQLETAEEVAAGAAQLFMRYGRAPLLDAGLPEKEEADRIVAAFRLMLHATATLMTYNFQRMVLNAVQAEVEKEGSAAEQEALRRETRRRRFEHGAA